MKIADLTEEELSSACGLAGQRVNAILAGPLYLSMIITI
jgi:hypothetical protein